MKHNYPAHVASGDDRNEFDDAFQEGESDNSDSCIRNDYPREAAGWHGYEAGVRAVPAARENWGEQAAYDDKYPPLPELPRP